MVACRCRWVVAALALTAGLLALPACSNKDKDDEGSGGGGGKSGPPAPGTIVNENLTGTRLSAAQAKSRNNLIKIGLGFHNYMSAYDSFPNNITSRDGKPLLSWRVVILPYIEEETLFKQFKLDEPWDSEHNKKLIPRMPKTYAVPGTDAEKGYTYYRSFAGPNTATPTADPSRPGPPVRVNLASIQDGFSNTLLVVEAADPVIWTKPDDIPFTGNEPMLPKVGGVFKDGFNVAMADGSVRLVKKSISEKTLRAAIGRNDGELLGGDW